jgi:Tol biopolymer transport system component
MLAACLTLGLSIAGMFAIQAHAIYGPATGGSGADIVSVDNASDEQGNASTTNADISADGRYVVFQTRATNFFEGDGGVVEGGVSKSDVEPPGTLREGGIFRYDRVTGALQLVADGTEVHADGPEKGEQIFQGAQNPSVSAEGRYVAFSTAQRLVPQDTNENVDVYVRDMTVPLTPGRADSGAYTLVSAKSGGSEPASYITHGPPVPGAEAGAEIWPNTSISGDGNYVVFRTTEVTTDLPDHATADTAPEQLFVRDIRAQTTTLISRDPTNAKYASGDPAGGAIGPAMISGDGSTVAWVSTNAPAQTIFLPGEPENSSEPFYLWRRWQEQAPTTRRITGIADPDDPNCHPGEGVTLSQTAEGPCYGPLSEPESSLSSIALTAPSLSSDGYTVAFLAGAALRPNITKSFGLDVFLTSMAPHVTRKEGTHELTLGVQSGNVGSTPSIESLALSADGSTIAFTSLRDRFVLSEPLPVGTFRASPTASDLYAIRLSENALERAVVNYEGSDPAGSVAVNPTLNGDGAVVAFTSSSSDLIFGDANQSADAFTASFQIPAGTAAPSSEVNPAQVGFTLTTSATPELGLHVKRAKDGGLTLLIETPGPGRLTAQARGKIAIRGKKTGKRVVLAHVSGIARAEGTATLTLHLARRYLEELKRAGKLRTSIMVDFAPPSPAEALSAETSASFTRPRPH